MKIDEAMVEHIAKLSRLELPETEKAAMTRELERILEHMDVLHACAALLIEKERINRDEFEALFENREHPTEQNAEA